ncbi:MAG: CHRD domain-containing protein [bacterium]|nr:CHRD domain-containing protein [bacterium]
MTTKKFLITTALVALPAIVLIGYSQWSIAKADSTHNQNMAYAGEMFSTNLNGSQEVPAVSTPAHGQAEFKEYQNSSKLDYTLTLNNIEDVTAAHLHCAMPGQNGPVVVPLFGAEDRSFKNGSIAGTISASDITEAGMTCQPNIQTFQHLIQAMREGKIYVNVHTVQNPQGEIRGQLMQGGNMSGAHATSTTNNTNTNTQNNQNSNQNNTSNNTTSNTSTGPQAGTHYEMVTSPEGYTGHCYEIDGVHYCQAQTKNSDSIFNSTETLTTNAVQTSANPDLGHNYVFVKPDAYHKMQGGNVSFRGSHFYPHETVTIKNGGTSLGTATADASGSFNTNAHSIPYTSGMQRYTFTGSMSQIEFPVEIWVDGANPWLGLSSYYAGDTSPLTISGNGFGSGEQVKVWFNGLDVGTVTANTNGEFSLNTMVPEGSVGQKLIKAQGMHTNATAEQSFSQAF